MSSTKKLSWGLGGLLAAALLWAFLPTAPTTHAQAPADGTFVEQVDVNIVNLEVFVTDKDGNPVTGLTADDFRLFIDKDETPISNFYAEQSGDPARQVAEPRERSRPADPEAVVPATTPPEQVLHLTVLVDNSNIRPTHRKRVFRHLQEFLSQNLPTEAQVSVASLGKGQSLTIHSDFLANRAVVGNILDDLENSPVQDAGQDVQRRQIISELFRGVGARGFRSNQDQTLLFRIRAFAAEEYDRSQVTLDTLSRFVTTLGGIPGRRALLYVADGIPIRPGEDLFYAWANAENIQEYMAGNITEYRRQIGNFDLTRQFEQFAALANANRVTFYSLDATGDHSSQIRAAATEGRVDTVVLSTFENNYREPQELVAQATGGKRLQASPQLDEDLRDMASDFVSFYSLGFEAEPTPDREWKDVRVEVVGRKDLRVRYRERFRPKPREQSLAERTLAVLLYGTGDNPLDVSVTTEAPSLRNDGAAVLPIKVRIPLSQVALIPEGESHTGNISIFVTTKDEAGNPRPVQKLPFHIQIPNEKFEEAMSQRAEYTLPLVVRPGDQQVALGVADDRSTVLSTLRLDLGDLVRLEG